jgi:prepilin-type processing-associated H-X9-DG protein
MTPLAVSNLFNVSFADGHNYNETVSKEMGFLDKKESQHC